MSRMNRKGRSKTGGKFVKLGDGLAASPAFRSLSGPAVKYYIELRRRYNGSNNGDLSLSLDEAKRLLHMGKATAGRARQELQDKGLIRMTKCGGFHQRLAATWALTDERTINRQPSYAYKEWSPSKENHRSPGGPPSVPRRTREPPNDPPSVPRRTDKGAFPASLRS